MIFLSLHQPEHELYTKIEIDRKIDQTHLRGRAEFLALLKAEDTYIVHLLVLYLTCETAPANMTPRRLFSLSPGHYQCYFWGCFFMLRSLKEKAKDVIKLPKFPHLDSIAFKGKRIDKVAKTHWSYIIFEASWASCSTFLRRCSPPAQEFLLLLFSSPLPLQHCVHNHPTDSLFLQTAFACFYFSSHLVDWLMKSIREREREIWMKKFSSQKNVLACFCLLVVDQGLSAGSGVFEDGRHCNLAVRKE